MDSSNLNLTISEKIQRGDGLMDDISMTLLEQNISLLEKGIALNEYLEKEMQLKVNGDTRIYNEYGFFVIHNKTKKRYLLDGGNNVSGYTMSSTIQQYFLSDNGYGNPHMHKDYANGDMLILTFWRYDSSKYASMDKFKEYIEAYYDSIGETYYDYVMRLRDGSYDKSKRPKGYNAYYNGKDPKKISDEFVNNSGKKKKILAERLLRLEHKSKFLYNLLNTIFDLLIKPIPLFFWVVSTNSYNIFAGSNAIQRTFSIFFGLIGAYFAAIIFYLILLLVIQIFKLFLCTYKPLVIHFRVFDIIIRLSSKKILKSNDKEVIELLYEHEDLVEARKEKRENGKSKAYERKKERDMRELEYAQQEYARAKESAERNRSSAEYNYKKAREGGTLFSSAEAKREEARRDDERAAYDEQNARYYEEKMRAKERALGIKRED